MAPSKDVAGPSQEALLKLEKSNDNSEIQLLTAAQILKLDLSEPILSFPDPTSFEISNRPAPKEEWVLRWLLKRLKTTAYRVQPLSFVLLEKILQRAPHRAIAATFVEYKFAQLLKDIVDDLDNAVFKQLRFSGFLIDSPGLPSGSETSETIERSPARSKKRKRGNDAAAAADDIEMHDVSQGDSQIDLAGAAYLRFLNALYVLMSLVNGQDDRGTVTLFHLQQSLRLDPAFVAPIFGKLLRISAGLVVFFIKQKRTGQLLQLLKTTIACFNLWDLKKSGINGVDKNYINAAFAKFCLIDALRLHRIILSAGIVSENATLITHSIEKLIALHVVLPARNDFMERGGSGIDYSKDEDPDWSAVQPVTANFKPLFEDLSGLVVDCDGIHVDGANQASCVFDATWRPAGLIPSFYNIVAKSVPRNSFRRQNSEASWLETVFVALAELAYSSARGSSGETSSFIALLEQLFAVVRARKINLSLHTILTHAAYTGLLKGKEHPEDVRWNLTTLLIELGADIFLPNSGFKDSGRLRDALFQSLHHIRSDSADKGTYQLVKERVVIPLLRAFAAARDLPNFVTYWTEQLREVESIRKSGYKEAYSVWEDDDVAAVYYDAVKSTSSDSQLKTQIEKAIPAVITSSGYISDSPDSYANFVILESSSRKWGHSGLPGLRIDLLTSLVEAIHKSISKRPQNLHWFWRLWRLTTNLIPMSRNDASNSTSEILTELKNKALQAMDVSNVSGYRESGGKTLQESLAACRFLLTTTREVYYDTSAGHKPVLHDLLGKITGIADFLFQDKLCGWNGRIHDLNTAAQLGTAYVECLMEFPTLLSTLPYKDIRIFVEFFWTLASADSKHWVLSKIPEVTECVTFKQLWSIFVSNDYLTDNPLLAVGTAKALCEVFMEMVESDQPQSLILKYLPGILQDLPSMPVRLNEIPRFGETVESVVTKIDCPTELIHNVIPLINRWCQESHHVEPVMKEFMTSDISLQRTAADVRTIDSFRSLVDTVFKSDYQDCQSSEDQYKCLKRFHKLASSRFSVASAKLESKPSKKDQSGSLTPVFVGTCLRLLAENIGDFSDTKSSKEITRLRNEMLELILARITACSQNLQHGGKIDHVKMAHSLAIMHLLLEDFDDLLIQKNIVVDLPLMASFEQSPDSTLLLQNIARRRKTARAATSEEFGFANASLLETIDICRMQASEQTYFAREATAKLKQMSNAERIAAIRELKTSGFKDSAGANRLLLVGLAVSVLDEITEKDSADAREVSSLCTAVTNVLQSSDNGIEQFSLAAECVDIILRLHPRGVSQFNIDNCLAAVATTMFKVLSKKDSYNEISPEFASTIYTRLCRLLGTIVGLYRQQLGGRFHILIPALQSLLKALFAPTPRSSNNKFGDRNSGLTLEVPHAVQFTRLLTSLCDPTVSAVSRPSRPGFGHGHDGLVDQTKKAKVIAGQHLRILIESYAQNMLEAPLKPEIKTALAPGLYAILDAMPTESKRALNAGMDVSSRAIFKTLHEDYVRFGKWNSKG